MREKTTLSRPLQPVLSPSLSTLEHSRANQTSIQTRQNKTHHLLKTFLNFFLNEMKFFCMLLQPFKSIEINWRITIVARETVALAFEWESCDVF